MKFILLRLFLFLLLFLLCPVFVQAETYLVFPFEAVGYEAQEGKTMAVWLAMEIKAATGAEVLLMDDAEPCHDATCAMKVLQNHPAEIAVVGSVSRLGSQTALMVQAVYQAKVLTHTLSLDGIEEFSRLAPRLAKAIVEQKSFEEAATVSTVTKREQEKYNRVEGDFSFGPGLGMLFPVGDSYGGRVDALLQFLIPFRYEISHAGFFFETGYYFDSRASEYDLVQEWPLDFGGMYYFSDRVGSPFIGGSFGLHNLHVEREYTREEKERNATDRLNGRIRAAISGNDDYRVDILEDDNWNYWTASVSVFGGYEFMRIHTAHISILAGYRFTAAELDGNFAHGAFINANFTFGVYRKK